MPVPELFVSLLRAGYTPAEMVLYPNEGHGFLGESQPACRHNAATRIVAWLQQHVLLKRKRGLNTPSTEAA